MGIIGDLYKCFIKGLFSYVFNTKSMELLVPTADTQIHNKTKNIHPSNANTLVHVPHYSGHRAMSFTSRKMGLLSI